MSASHNSKEAEAFVGVGSWMICAVLWLALPLSCFGADTWIRIKSQDLVLIGNAGESTIRQVAEELAQFRTAVRMPWDAASHVPSKPLVVVVFKDEKSFGPFRPLGANQVAGYFLGGEDVSYICINPGARRRLDTVILHEYVHEMLIQFSRQAPVWAGEGLAEYYSTFDWGDGRKPVVGIGIAEHLRTLGRTTMVPLATLLNAQPGVFLTAKTSTRNLYYAQAWLLVHYLMNGSGGAHREGFIRYLSLPRHPGGTDEEALFRRELPAVPATIEMELKSYLKSRPFPTERVRLVEEAGVQPKLRALPMNEIELNACFGNLLLQANRQAEAETYLLRAIDTDPGNADARSSLGILRVRQNRLTEARRELELAVSSPDARPVAHYYFVRSLEQSPGGNFLVSNEPRKKEMIVNHLRKTIEALPGHADSYHLLAYVNLFFREDIDEALKLAARAVQLAPEETSYLLTLAQLQIAKSDLTAARSTLNSLYGRQPDDALRALAARVEEQLQAAEREAAKRP